MWINLFNSDRMYEHYNGANRNNVWIVLARGWSQKKAVLMSRRESSKNQHYIQRWIKDLEFLERLKFLIVLNFKI